MREIFLVFRSRSQAMQFLEATKSYLIPAKIINTPKGAMAGCGLSVKMFHRDLSKANTLLTRGNYSTFVAIFEVLKGGAYKRIV